MEPLKLISNSGNSRGTTEKGSGSGGFASLEAGAIVIWRVVDFFFQQLQF